MILPDGGYFWNTSHQIEYICELRFVTSLDLKQLAIFSKYLAIRKITKLSRNMLCYICISFISIIYSFEEERFGPVKLIWPIHSSHWSTCIKSEMKAVMYLCVRSIKFVFFIRFSYWILQLFRQCGIFFFSFPFNKYIKGIILKQFHCIILLFTLSLSLIW